MSRNNVKESDVKSASSSMSALSDDTLEPVFAVDTSAPPLYSPATPSPVPRLDFNRLATTPTTPPSARFHNHNNDPSDPHSSRPMIAPYSPSPRVHPPYVELSSRGSNHKPLVSFMDDAVLNSARSVPPRRGSLPFTPDNTTVVSIPNTPQQQKNKRDVLDGLAELLVAFLYAASSGEVSNATQTVVNDAVKTESLFLNNAIRSLCYSVTGLALFTVVFMYRAVNCCLERRDLTEMVDNLLSGRKRDIAFSCFFMLIGGILQATQMNQSAADKNSIVIGFSSLFVIFAGYLSGGGSVNTLAPNASRVHPNQTPPTPVARSREPDYIPPTAAEQPSEQNVASEAVLQGLVVPQPGRSPQQKETLRNYLLLLLSCRNAMIAAAGNGLTYSPKSTDVNVQDLLQNIAIIHLFFGGLTYILLCIALIYEKYCTKHDEPVSWSDLFHRHFSGIKLQIILSALFSLAGASVLMTQGSIVSRSQVSMQIAQWLLAVSGFLTGAKIGSTFSRSKQGASSGLSADGGSGHHLPGLARGGSDNTLSASYGARPRGFSTAF